MPVFFCFCFCLLFFMRRKLNSFRTTPLASKKLCFFLVVVVVRNIHIYEYKFQVYKKINKMVDICCYCYWCCCCCFISTLKRRQTVFHCLACQYILTMYLRTTTQKDYIESVISYNVTLAYIHIHTYTKGTKNEGGGFST